MVQIIELLVRAHVAIATRYCEAGGAPQSQDCIRRERARVIAEEVLRQRHVLKRQRPRVFVLQNHCRQNF